jgi:hypothetical protein
MADDTPDILQDVLQDGLQVVLCGTAVGTASAIAGACLLRAQAEQVLEDPARDRAHA